MKKSILISDPFCEQHIINPKKPAKKFKRVKRIKHDQNKQNDEKVTKPVIVASANTTKSINLLKRVDGPRKKERGPIFKTKDHRNEMYSSDSSRSLLRAESPSMLELHRLDMKFKSFAQMDREFEEIMTEMNIDMQETYNEVEETQNSTNIAASPEVIISRDYPSYETMEDDIIPSFLPPQSRRASLATSSLSGIKPLASDLLPSTDIPSTKSNESVKSNRSQASSSSKKNDRKEAVCEEIVKNEDVKEACSSDKAITLVVQDSLLDEVTEEPLRIFGNQYPIPLPSIPHTDTQVAQKPTEGKAKIHNLCLIKGDDACDKKLLESRYAHTVDKYNKKVSDRENGMQTIVSEIEPYSQTIMQITDQKSILSQCSKSDIDETVEENIDSCVDIAARIMQKIENNTQIDCSNEITEFHFIQQEIYEMFDHEYPMVYGKKLQLIDDPSRHYEFPGPPKFHIAPSVVGEELATDYKSHVRDSKMLLPQQQHMPVTPSDRPQPCIGLNRLINRECVSALEMESESDDDVIIPANLNPVERFETIIERRRKYKKKQRAKQGLLKRSNSQPELSHVTGEDNFSSDFQSVIEEAKYQAEKYELIKKEDEEQISEVLEEIPFVHVSKSCGDIASKCVVVPTLKKSLSENNVPALQCNNFDSEPKDIVAPLVLLSGASESRKKKESLSIEPLFGGTQSIERLLRGIEEVSLRLRNLEENDGLTSFFLCRRGALYRKLGRFSKCAEDLSRAAKLEPGLLDIYWNRHLMFLAQGNTEKAIKDLQFIVQQNRKHTHAYWSLGKIFAEEGNLNEAISNYTEAIRCKPNDEQLYYERAAIFEKRNDHMLAIGDYKEATKLQPQNILGLRKIAMYHFQLGLWPTSVTEFTELLVHCPKDVDTYFHRGRANAKMVRYKEAVSDLTTCLYLDANHYKAFYHRACLLRRVNPKQALQDFSVSLLINSTVDNILSYMHRGILYTQMNRYEPAKCDFGEAVRLDMKLAVAHVNIGLIDMKQNNLPEALRRFNIALKMDPTYIRALLCRAQAYRTNNFVNYAIVDYTKAIHQNPINLDYRVSRGRLLLEKGMFTEASAHIRQCAEMNSNRNVSSTQQAVVEIFLNNFDKAIAILEKASRNMPSAEILTLLGKTKMKAKRYRDSIDNFNAALELMRPWIATMAWPKESATIDYHAARCYMQTQDYNLALAHLNHALNKSDPEFAEAYYERGLVKVKLNIPKAVQDFNRALIYKPKFFQAYLGRATYYGGCGRYAKAIVSCNEALILQPRSIRAYIYRGVLKLKSKSYELAISDFTQAIELDKTCYLAFFNRAVCYHERKFCFKALKDYSIVLMSTTNDLWTKALLNRAILYFEIDDIENAVNDFDLALESSNNDPRILHSLATCYQRLGKEDLAVYLFTRALEMDNSFTDALLGRASVLMSSTFSLLKTRARRDYARSLHLDPRCLQARVALARCLQDEGKYMRAWNMFTTTIDIDPTYSLAHERRALVSLRMNNLFGCLLDLNNAIKVKETAQLLTNRGLVHQTMGDRVNAMRDYHSALRLDHSFGLAYFNIANLYFLNKQFSQALNYYTKAIDWQANCCALINRALVKFIQNDLQGALQDFNIAETKSTWHLYFNRGALYQKLEKYEEAAHDYTKALHLCPGDALLYKRRADVLGKMGKKEEALRDYYEAVCLQTKNVTSNVNNKT